MMTLHIPTSTVRLLLAVLVCCVCSSASYAQGKGDGDTADNIVGREVRLSDNLVGRKVRLWEGTSVNAPSVTLEIFLPESVATEHPSATEQRPAPTPAVIVCPGGSYCWHDYDTEGTMVARWLSSNGIAAFVLNYRVQGVFDYIMHTRYITRGHKHPQMIQDGQRAIQYIRENADIFNVDTARVGAMGFSAGGHLAMSMAEFFHTDFLAPLGITHTVSLRPDFVAPIYPVVTMTEPVVHKRSRRALLGEYGKRRQAMRDSLSLERHVPADCPPVFLVNCKDDPIVKYHNSVLLDSALTARHTPHRYIQYLTGGHGFGASDNKGTPECRQWRTEFLNWLRELYKQQCF